MKENNIRFIIDNCIKLKEKSVWLAEELHSLRREQENVHSMADVANEIDDMVKAIISMLDSFENQGV